MAPQTSSLSPACEHLDLSDKDRIKLRKPLVEKLRRDRINNCIEELKSLLEREFHSQEPNAKLEKADILEMTVSFLKRQQQLGPLLDHRDFNKGYFQCWKKSVHFLSTSDRAPCSNHHSEPQRDSQELSSSPSLSSPSLSISMMSSTPVITKQHSVDVIHLALTKRSIWRPWQ